MTESGKCSADAGPPWQPLLGVLLHTGQKTEDGKVCRTSCMYAFSHWSPTYICKCCHRNARDSFLPAKSILGIMGPENSFVRQTANRQLLINHTLNFCHLTGRGGGSYTLNASYSTVKKSDSLLVSVSVWQSGNFNSQSGVI